MQMRVLNYRVLLRKEPEGAFTVIIPSLPGCVTCGDSIDEAIEMAKEAISLYIESLAVSLPKQSGICEICNRKIDYLNSLSNIK
jgi:antitoxin HicB